MPYIAKEIRKCYDKRLETLFKGMPIGMNPGDLNYILTKIVQKYVELNNLNYGSINDVVGVLECAKLELYRRLAAPYENKKKKRNGDVY